MLDCYLYIMFRNDYIKMCYIIYNKGYNVINIDIK